MTIFERIEIGLHIVHTLNVHLEQLQFELLVFPHKLHFLADLKSRFNTQGLHFTLQGKDEVVTTYTSLLLIWSTNLVSF